MHDSHIHISMSPLRENIETDISEFLDLNGKKILTQTTDISDYQETLDIYHKLNTKYPNVIDFALGLHPERIEEGMLKNDLDDMDIFKYSQKQYDLFLEFFQKNINDITAIGECGLDYFTMYEYNQFTDSQIDQLKEAQRRILSKICKLAIKYDLPMSIHSRGSNGDSSCTKDTIAIVAKEGKGSLRGCFHSYTGSLDMLEKILNLGMYVGFNAIITYPSGENVREILRNTPLDRILFETDGPYLPTQSVRKNKKLEKRYGRPVLIKEIMEKAAEIKDISYTKIEELADQNYITLFSKKGM